MAMGLHKSGGRGGRGRSRAAPMSEINVTPLVDVMLVLLIIFMVTAPLLTSGVPVDLPETNARPLDQPQQPPVQISLTQAGGLFIDDRAVTMTALPARLAALAAAPDSDERTIMLRADRALDYGKVMRVMGELNRAGLIHVSMVTTGSSAPE
ncbi:MAG: protein TolR [Pseudomonadota bacterium]